MNNQTLVIYDFDIMYDILKEIEGHLTFNLINISKNNLKRPKSLINILKK